MTRLTSLAACSLFASAALFAASRAETTTYVDGNLTGVSPNTGGTLVFTDEKAMMFRTGLATVPVPYAGITKAELGATKANSHDVPFYKLWALHKKSGKTETQFLVVEFKSDEGEAKTMTLEVAKTSADDILSTIESHTGKGTAVASAESPASGAAPAAAPPAVSMKSAEGPVSASAKPAATASKSNEEWWGDSIWKTTRNADKWSKPAGSNAPQD